nr:hypothetical protein [uncultured Rhodopila sp.]
MMKLTMAAGSCRARDAACWIGFAASPTFAVMAWIAAADAPRLSICASSSAIGGMAWMYLLMSVFHAPAWLKLAFPTNNTEGV